MSTDHNFLKRAEAEPNQCPSAYQPNALPLGQTDWWHGLLWSWGVGYNTTSIWGMCGLVIRAQEMCERLSGRPGLPVPNSPYGLCGRKATQLLHNYYTVRVQELCECGCDRPGFPAPNSPYVKQHWRRWAEEGLVRFCQTLCNSVRTEDGAGGGGQWARCV